MFINHTSREVTAKIVYYGPGLSGKTTNLQYIFSVTNPITRGELVSIETEIERTLFFDLLPINVGLIKGYQARFQLYTVPGQIFYDSTRKMVLKGADGIVFVADSQELMEQANLESYKNLKTNLEGQNQDVEKIPLTFQFNKRDLNNILSAERLNKQLNLSRRPFFEAIATRGEGVIETLREISSLTLTRIKELIDQSQEIFKKKLSIVFDMDKKHKIIKKNDLPYKKITVESIEDYKEETTPGKIIVDTKNEVPAAIKGFKEDEVKIEVEKSEPAEKKEKEVKMEVEKPEPVEKKDEKVEKEDTGSGLKNKEKVAENKEEFETNEIKIDLEEENKNLETVNIEAVKEEPERVKEEKAENKVKNKDKGFDILDSFEDKSRLTVLKKISLKDQNITIEVKDKDSTLTDPIQLDVDKEVKKITIILDIKK